MLYLIIFGALILLGLGATAAYYVIKLRKVQTQQTQQIQKNREAWQKHRDELASDLKFIANAMVQGQCEITEGCMRLAVLMDRLDDELQHNHQFTTIRAHFSQTAHMPTHEAYKALTRKEKFKLDNQRYALEEQNREQVLNEAKALLAYRFEILTPN